MTVGKSDLNRFDVPVCYLHQRESLFDNGWVPWFTSLAFQACSVVSTKKTNSDDIELRKSSHCHLTTSRNYHCYVGGVVIDQWADDWDRCAAQRGLPSNPYSQTLGSFVSVCTLYPIESLLHSLTSSDPRNIGGICDDVASDKRRHLEWYGLSAQYDSFGTGNFRHSEGWTWMAQSHRHVKKGHLFRDLLEDPAFFQDSLHRCSFFVLCWSKA